MQKSHQKDIDFVYWQYTGTATNHDTYLKSPLQIDSDASGAGQTFSQSVGIDTWTTLNDPIASATDVTEAAFDALTHKRRRNCFAYAKYAHHGKLHNRYRCIWRFAGKGFYFFKIKVAEKVFLESNQLP